MQARDFLVVAALAAAGWWYSQQPADTPRPLPAPSPDQPCPGPGPCPIKPAPKPTPPRKPWGTPAGSSVGDQVAALVGDIEAGGKGPCLCCPSCKCELGRCPCRLTGAPSGGRCNRSCGCGGGRGRELVQSLPYDGQARQAQVGGNVAPDGKTEIQVDLPGSLHQKNTGGSDGAGLCVYASARHSGLWQNNRVFAELFDWMKQHPGGSYPAKFDKTVEQFCQERGLPKPAYLQVEGRDLEILKLACKTGRMPGVTYSISPTGRYKGQRIAHMTSLAHADGTWYAILDNNYPGHDQYEWMNEEEFLKAYTGGKSGWAVILLDPGPPPVPKN